MSSLAVYREWAWQYITLWGRTKSCLVTLGSIQCAVESHRTCVLNLTWLGYLDASQWCQYTKVAVVSFPLREI